MDEICNMVQKNQDFRVQDAKTQTDITKQILTQAILDKEQKGYSILPEEFLKQIIKLYGNSAIESDYASFYIEGLKNFSYFIDANLQNMQNFSQDFTKNWQEGIKQEGKNFNPLNISNIPFENSFENTLKMWNDFFKK